MDARERGDDCIVAWGTGGASREFLYVRDVAEGIVAPAVQYNCCEPVNLGSGIEITIRELVARIARLTHSEGEVVWDTTKLDGQPRRCLDTSRARREFGWRATTDLDWVAGDG